ncbi:hypothetical protein BD833_104148 [Blastococcus xanthinilyticus]|uniref:Uncharacterized protein n=1 Tax=Blastococcus xanthinilyticus TaxID=1564164 RepID=A0A5S5CZD1_9ACTN|nr:hypothetical protein BD833_104148 [Blastococcus xanthinilyticus]
MATTEPVRDGRCPQCNSRVRPLHSGSAPVLDSSFTAPMWVPKVCTNQLCEWVEPEPN